MTDACYIPYRAVNDMTLPRSGLRLLLSLRACYGPQEVFSVTLSDLKELSGLSIPTIRTALAALLHAGYLNPVGQLHCEHRRCCFQQEPALKLHRDLCSRLLVPELPNAAMVVFLYLYQCLSMGHLDQSLRDIAAHVGIHTGRVVEDLKILFAAGLLQVERRTGKNGSNLCNRYSIPGAATTN